MKSFTPDTEFPFDAIVGNKIPKSIFLAGTIDDGASINWQEKVIDKLKELDITLLNPRVEYWNNDIKQSASDPAFKRQVDWEQDGLKFADIIFMYFVGGSRSIISMSELGQYSNSGKIIVVADNDYFKRGNIEVLSIRDGFHLFDNLEDGLELLIALVK